MQVKLSAKTKMANWSLAPKQQVNLLRRNLAKIEVMEKSGCADVAVKLP